MTNTNPTRIKHHIDVPDDLFDISNKFFNSNKECYLVGGSVRDSLLGKTPKDFDIATNATPDEVIEILGKDPKYKLKTVGKAFGVVIVKSPSGEEFEIATFRKDMSAGRRPDSVEFTDIETDVNRRDLTINSLFYDLKNHEIVDYIGGINDIKNNVVRTVGDPDLRFGEDRLRVLRAFRFALRLGSSFDKNTENSIKKNNSLIGVSSERIRDELLKCIASSKNMGRLPGFLDEFNMWPQIFPELKNGPQYLRTKNVPVFLASWLEKNDTKFLASKLNELKYTAEEISQICFLIDFGKLDEDLKILKTKKAFKNSKLTESDLIEYISGMYPEKEQLAKKFLSFQPSVSTEELMSQGFLGKELGIEIDKREQNLWEKWIMKITENILKKLIKEVLGDLSIDKKNVNGDDLLLKQLNRASKYEWKIEHERDSDDARSPGKLSNFVAFVSDIDDESRWRLGVYRTPTLSATSSGEPFKYEIWPTLEYDNRGDPEKFPPIKGTQTDALRFIMTIDSSIKKWSRTYYDDKFLK